MFSIIMVIAAFCGGVFGAAIGALPAFIFVGITGLVGVGVQLAGGPPTIINDIAFGNLFGPHVAFAPAAVAAGYAANKKKNLEDGMDILSPLAKTNDISVLLVGGFFGVLGYLINTCFASIKLPTDTVAMTVFTLGVIGRFMFGSTGLFGKFSQTKSNDEVSSEIAATAEVVKRSYISDSKSLVFNSLIALAISFCVSNIVQITHIGAIGFVISAISLIFVQMGYGLPATHHITLTAGYATLATGNIFIGALFGLIAGILGDIIGRTINSYCDTHIDPPATTIFICAFVIFIFL